jgi:hypothetical protein
MHQEHLLERILDAVGSKDSSNKTFKLFVLHYSENHIERAIGEFKEAEASMTITGSQDKQRYFTAIMKRLAQDLKVKWIKADT